MIHQNIRARAIEKGDKRRQLKRAQGGYLMISMMMALFVTGALITLYVERQAERARLERGEQVGYALEVLGAAFAAYLNENNHKFIDSQVKIDGFANPFEPTAEELIKNLSVRGVAPKPPVITDGSYKFEVSFASGCDTKLKRSEVRCRPDGLAYINKPLMRGASADFVALARATRIMKGRGGYARPESPSQFRFLDSAVAPATNKITNPTGIAGVLAYRADSLREGEEYLKTDGSNRMRSTLRLDGNNVNHDLAGVKDITASGDITTSGRLEVRGGVPGKSWGLTVNNDTIISGDLRAVGETRVDNLKFETRHNFGDQCRSQYSIGMSRGGELLYCGAAKKWVYFKQYSEPEVDLQAVKMVLEGKEPFAANYYLGHWINCTAFFVNYMDSLRVSRNFMGGWNAWYDNKSGAENAEVICFGRMKNRQIPRINFKDSPTR